MKLSDMQRWWLVAASVLAFKLVVLMVIPIKANLDTPDWLIVGMAAFASLGILLAIVGYVPRKFMYKDMSVELTGQAERMENLLREIFDRVSIQDRQAIGGFIAELLSLSGGPEGRIQSMSRLVEQGMEGGLDDVLNRLGCSFEKDYKVGAGVGGPAILDYFIKDSKVGIELVSYGNSQTRGQLERRIKKAFSSKMVERFVVIPNAKVLSLYESVFSSDQWENVHVIPADGNVESSLRKVVGCPSKVALPS